MQCVCVKVIDKRLVERGWHLKIGGMMICANCIRSWFDTG